MNTDQLIWEGAVAKSCVELFTDSQITELIYDLDDVIHQVVDKHWAKHSLYDPIVREKFIELVGLDTATELMAEVTD